MRFFCFPLNSRTIYIDLIILRTNRIVKLLRHLKIKIFPWTTNLLKLKQPLLVELNHLQLNLHPNKSPKQLSKNRKVANLKNAFIAGQRASLLGVNPPRNPHHWKHKTVALRRYLTPM